MWIDTKYTGWGSPQIDICRLNEGRTLIKVCRTTIGSRTRSVQPLLKIRLFSGTPCILQPSTDRRTAYVERDDEGFRVLTIPGHTKGEKRWQKRVFTKKVLPPRYKAIPLGKEWTNIWPTARTFNWSLVPFPVRQGLSIREENDGIPWGKYANAELMKIPNFLHLTPAHIKKHVQALKKFTTKWPEGLDTDEACREHFPVEVTTRDYLIDRATLRDDRARNITIKYLLSDLDLDHHALDKMIRLLGDKYDPVSGVVTLELDRCPLKKQNYEFGVYLMTVLFKESWKTEAWEKEREEVDMEKYTWDMNSSKPRTIDTIMRMKQVAVDNIDKFASPVTSELPLSPGPADISNAPSVKTYIESLESLHDIGEDLNSLTKYKDAVKAMLLPRSAVST